VSASRRNTVCNVKPVPDENRDPVNAVEEAQTYPTPSGLKHVEVEEEEPPPAPFVHGILKAVGPGLVPPDLNQWQLHRSIEESVEHYFEACKVRSNKDRTEQTSQIDRLKQICEAAQLLADVLPSRGVRPRRPFSKSRRISGERGVEGNADNGADQSRRAQTGSQGRAKQKTPLIEAEALALLCEAGRIEAASIAALGRMWGWERSRTSKALIRWEKAGRINRENGPSGKIVIRGQEQAGNGNGVNGGNAASPVHKRKTGRAGLPP
jgi:hypothetical protein